jgi:hypothetical protein
MTVNEGSAPAVAEMNIRTTVQLHEISYERALLVSLLAQAQADGDRTFSVFRHASLAVRRDPETILDELSTATDWTVARVNVHTLTLRAVGLFGIVETQGSPEQCSLDLQLWADGGGRADAARERILAGLRAFEIQDLAFALNWRFLDGKGNIVRAKTEERAGPALLDEAYPSLGCITGFIEEYLSAPEAVLVLQGPPGTGKTRLIRAILAGLSRRRGHTAEVLYTGDSAVLESDEVFLEFITESASAFVVEDADHLLAPRTGGNRTLHRFLNIADGIASAHGKKVIFSTNLPNVRDIDEALVRPGRCFAHVFLQELSADQAVQLFDRLCAEKPEERPAPLDLAQQKSWSVAAVYAAFRAVGPTQALARGPFAVAGGAKRAAFGFN